MAPEGTYADSARIQSAVNRLGVAHKRMVVSRKQTEKLLPKERSEVQVVSLFLVKILCYYRYKASNESDKTCFPINFQAFLTEHRNTILISYTVLHCRVPNQIKREGCIRVILTTIISVTDYTVKF